MHFKTIVLFTLLLITPIHAQDAPSWRSDFGQGTVSSFIYKTDTAYFGIDCPAGNAKPIGIYFITPAYDRYGSGTLAVSVVADDVAITIEMTDGYFEASDPGKLQSVRDIIALLAGARSASFSVATAGYKELEEFPLLGAAKELADNGRPDNVRVCLTDAYRQKAQAFWEMLAGDEQPWAAWKD